MGYIWFRLTLVAISADINSHQERKTSTTVDAKHGRVLADLKFTS